MDQNISPPAPTLGAILLQQGKLTAVQLAVGLHLQHHSPDYQGCRLGGILVRCGFINEDDLIDALALQPALIAEVEHALLQLRLTSD